MSRALTVLVLAVALATATRAGARRGAVATEHPLAAAAGAEILRAGGTVVDAAVAAAAAVCVVHPSSCGLGGGGFALVHLADGRDVALDYRERAPAAATPDRYFEGGKPIEARARSGGLAVAVPGEAAGLTMLNRRFGRLPLARVLEPAVRLAADGFALTEAPHLRREIERSLDLLRADPGLRATFLDPDGAPPPGDFRVRQPDLAATLTRLGRRGAASLLRGSTARAIAGAAHDRGGVLTTADLAVYRPVWRRPIARGFRGRRVVTFPPPGSGGVLLEMLGILGRISGVVDNFQLNVLPMDGFPKSGLFARRRVPARVAEVENPQSAGALMRSPFQFARHGQCGMWVSEALPRLARQCFS